MKRRTFFKTTLSSLTAILLSKFSFTSKMKELPRVLILGDSISIGYTPFVKTILATTAEVYRPMFENGKPENCQGTTNGVKNIDKWLGNTNWDVIHFNFGLHDLKQVDPRTGKNSKNPDHPHQADIKQYKKNLKEIVEKLQNTGAKLVFATTTPYPDELKNAIRKPKLYKKYNNAAVKIMNRKKITINNLCAFMTPRMNDLQKPKDVHFTGEGSKALANQVAKEIIKIL